MYKVPVTVCSAFLIFYLLWIDRKNHEDVSKAIWIPFVSLLFAGSREISFWLSYWFNIGSYSGSIAEGNAIERLFHTTLLLLGIAVLIKRKINWPEMLKGNIFIVLYFAFGLMSIAWSDFPFVALKRLIKTGSTLVMVLVVLTEAKPYVALGTILRRLAIIFLPLSILFIWYYPALGKSYHSYSGTQWFTGVSGNKNGLGAICLVSGIYLTWKFFASRWSSEVVGEKLRFLLYITLSPILIWLLYKANSATSLACLLIAVCIFVIARQKFVVSFPWRLIVICLGSVILYGTLESMFDIKNTIIAMLGRRPDLTTRIPMWQDLLSTVQNPLVGYGYESYWLGDRLAYIQKNWGTEIIQAHNGYIETYINTGAIGVTLLVLWILTGFKKISKRLITNYWVAVLQFCLVLVVCFYNYTEACFYGVGMLWFLFLFSTMDSSDQTILLNGAQPNGWSS
jgi:O-antigen ligase